MDLQHASIGAGNDLRSGIDADHLLPGASVERDHIFASRCGFSRRSLTGFAHADDDHLAMQMTNADLRRRAFSQGEGRIGTMLMMALDNHAGAGGGLAGAHIGNTYHTTLKLSL